MQKRIGNDFTVTLNITRKGSPEDFTTASGITVVLQHMTCSFIRLMPNQITVNGSKISFPVSAAQQKEPGKYRVLVKYHKTAFDGIKTYTVDKCDIFELVSDDCGIDATDTDVVADIDVKIEQDGKDGLSAYELDVLINNYQGTLEEWLNEVHSGTGGNVDLSDYYTKEEVNKELENKVPVEDGKGLSSNDYTNEEKARITKLENDFYNVTGAVISTSEQKVSIFRYGGKDYDVYELTVEPSNLPVVAGESVDILVSEQPCGNNLYLKTDCLSIATGTGDKSVFPVTAYTVKRFMWMIT